MTEQILLPHAYGSLEPYAPGKHAVLGEPPGPPMGRIAYAAAHVVADPLADVDPTSRAALDWEATMSYRRDLWSLRFSLAEAMDTAQRVSVQARFLIGRIEAVLAPGTTRMQGLD